MDCCHLMITFFEHLHLHLKILMSHGSHRSLPHFGMMSTPGLGEIFTVGRAMTPVTSLHFRGYFYDWILGSLLGFHQQTCS